MNKGKKTREKFQSGTTDSIRPYCIELIGISGKDLTPTARDAIHRCNTVVASARYRSLVEDMKKTIIPIAPVREMLDGLEDALNAGDVAVLASGDPLFFGVGRTLINRFGRKRVNIHPALSSMQLACARLRIPWDDMAFMSLHGRETDDPVARILRRKNTLIFTDHRHSPDGIAAAIARRLSFYDDTHLLANMKVHVAENIGVDQERIISGTPEEIANQTFAHLNIMIVQVPDDTGAAGMPVFGLKEHDIFHSRGLITKDEVRAATLHALRLPATGCLWDIGAGSGSVSLEAARLCPDITVWSVEKKKQEHVNIIKNIRKFRCYNINLIKGEAPAALKNLPDPDAVFIGGSGGRLADIIEQCASRLRSGGRMVVNAVLAETAGSGPAFMAASGLEVTVSTISVSRKKTERDTESLNSITIITGEK